MRNGAIRHLRYRHGPRCILLALTLRRAMYSLRQYISLFAQVTRRIRQLSGHCSAQAALGFQLAAWCRRRTFLPMRQRSPAGHAIGSEFDHVAPLSVLDRSDLVAGPSERQIFPVPLFIELASAREIGCCYDGPYGLNIMVGSCCSKSSAAVELQGILPFGPTSNSTLLVGYTGYYRSFTKGLPAAGDLSSCTILQGQTSTSRARQQNQRHTSRCKKSRGAPLVDPVASAF